MSLRQLLAILCVMLLVAQLTSGAESKGPIEAGSLQVVEEHEKRAQDFLDKIAYAASHHITQPPPTQEPTMVTPSSNETTPTEQPTDGTGATATPSDHPTTAKPPVGSSNFKVTILNGALIGVIVVILLVDIVLAVIKCKKN